MKFLKLACASVLWFASLTPLLAQGTWENVIWHAPTSTTATGNALTKAPGVANGWNADAISIQSISVDGSFEFSFDQNNKRMAAGLSYQQAGTSYTTFNYGIIANANTDNTLASGKIFLRVNAANVTCVACPERALEYSGAGCPGALEWMGFRGADLGL